MRLKFTRTKLFDRVSIPELHMKCKIISIKQRMQRQVLWLMYLLSKEKSYLHVPARQTSLYVQYQKV